MKIKDLLHCELVSIRPEANFRDAIIKMQTANVNSILVVGDDGKLVGVLDTITLINAVMPDYFGQKENKIACIVTEELLEEFIDANRNLKVSSFMLQEYEVLEEDSSLMEVFATFSGTHLFLIPVVDNENRPVGVITREGIRKLFVSKLGIQKMTDNT